MDLEKIAVVLVETYKASLVIADSDMNNYFLVVCEEHENIKLGLDLSRDHFLKKPQIDDTIHVLKNYKKLCDMYDVSRTIAICNFSAENKPKNIYSFFDEVFASCGFRFTLMSAEDQSAAIYSSAINTYDIPKAIAFRIGSDSVNVVHYNRRNILNHTMLGIGPVALLDMFGGEGYAPDVLFSKIRKYVETQLLDHDWIKNIELEFGLVGSDKVFTDIAKMVRKYKKYPLEKDDNFEITLADIDYLEKQLIELNLDATKKIKGIEEPRGDVFTVAVIIVGVIMRVTGKESLTVASRSIINGVLLKEVVPVTLEKPISDVLGFSVVNETCHYDPENTKHNEQVYNLAMLLFKQLRVLHKLPRGYVKVLRVASYMHDAGKRISPRNHAKHAFPVIVNSDIYGVTHRELVLASFVASLHDGADIAMSDWVKYKDILTDEDIDAVKKLGSILRLAESFDYTKSNTIADISCDILGDSVIMKTIAVGDNSYEIEKAQEGAKEFEKYFHKKIEIL